MVKCEWYLYLYRTVVHIATTLYKTHSNKALIVLAMTRIVCQTLTYIDCSWTWCLNRALSMRMAETWTIDVPYHLYMTRSMRRNCSISLGIETTYGTKKRGEVWQGADKFTRWKTTEGKAPTSQNLLNSLHSWLSCKLWQDFWNFVILKLCWYLLRIFQ